MSLDYNRDYTNKISIISTVGTSILTNNSKYREISNELQNLSNISQLSYQNGILSFDKNNYDNFKKYTSYKNMFSINKNDIFEEKYNCSAELTTIYKILEEDSKNYFNANQYKLLSSLKEYTELFYNKTIDFINGKEIDRKVFISSISEMLSVCNKETLDKYKIFLNENYINSNNEIKKEFGKYINQLPTNMKVINKKVDLYFISTDSLTGILASEILYEFTKNKVITFNYDNITITYDLNKESLKTDSIFLIENLNVNNSQLFKTYGVNNLFKKLDDILDNYKDKEVRLLYSVTGGHKLIVPFVTIHSYLKVIDSYYIFNDKHAMLYKIPRVSLSLDEHLLINYRSMLKQFNNKRQHVIKNKSNTDKLEYLENEGLVVYDSTSNSYSLSYLGKMFKDHIRKSDVKDVQFGAVFERFIFTDIIKAKGNVCRRFLPDSQNVDVYTDVVIYENEKNTVFGEMDLLFVNNDQDYAITEIKSLGAAGYDGNTSKVANQIIKYLNFIEDQYFKTNKFKVDFNDNNELGAPKEIKIMVVGDFENVLYDEYRADSVFFRYKELFDEYVKKSSCEQLKNIKLSFTRVDLSISTTKSKGDHLRYQDYDFSINNWSNEIYMLEGDTKCIASKKNKENLIKEENNTSISIKDISILKEKKILRQCLKDNQLTIDYSFSFEENKEYYNSGEQIYVSNSSKSTIPCTLMTFDQFCYYGLILKKYLSKSVLLDKYYYFTKKEYEELLALGIDVTIAGKTTLEIESKKVYKQSYSYNM